jgi:RNA polymerase sigma-70 factor (ECF subfamily)
MVHPTVQRRPSSDNASKPDRSLLSRLRRGDKEAASDLYRRYARRVLGLARKSITGRLQSRLDAEDIVQSVFRMFFTAARGSAYDIPATADLWNLISVIALNKIRAMAAFHRAAKRDVRMTAALHLDVPARSTKGPSGLEMSQAVIQEALDSLPGRQRQILELRLQSYTVEEISEQIQRSKRTVERNLQSARDQLVTLLQSGQQSSTPSHDDLPKSRARRSPKA